MLRWIAALAVLTVLAAGALVNSQQAALSVPDWPRSYGQWVMKTPWVGGIRFEHSHRLLAAAAAVLLIVLPLLTRQKKLAWSAFALYLVQVFLGAAIVMMGRPRPVSALHGIIAQAVAVLVLLAVLPPPKGRRDAGTTRWIKVLSVLVILQPIAGVLSRHPLSKTAFIVALLSHVFLALVLLVVLPTTAIKVIRRVPPLRAAGVILLCLFLAQIAVGGLLFIISPEPLSETWPPEPYFPEAHVAHVLLAAGLVATTLWLRHGIAGAD